MHRACQYWACIPSITVHGSFESWLVWVSCKLLKWVMGCAGEATQLSEGQREAIRTAARSPVCVVTGGPGCGKTTATKYIVSLWAAMNKRLAICAPTGHAPSPPHTLPLHILPPPPLPFVSTWQSCWPCPCSSPSLLHSLDGAVSWQRLSVCDQTAIYAAAVILLPQHTFCNAQL